MLDFAVACLAWLMVVGAYWTLKLYRMLSRIELTLMAVRAQVDSNARGLAAIKAYLASKEIGGTPEDEELPF